MLVSWFSNTSVYSKGWSHKAVVDLTYTIVYVPNNLDDLFWIPHSMFKLSSFAFLALLPVQFKHDAAGVGGIVQLEPENHTTFHRRPSMSAILARESDFGAVFESSPAVTGWVEGGN